LNHSMRVKLNILTEVAIILYDCIRCRMKIAVAIVLLSTVFANVASHGRVFYIFYNCKFAITVGVTILVVWVK